jgi:hypothetical protein
MATTVANWDFQSNHVQEGDGIYTGQDFISSESVVVCAIPTPTSGDGDNTTTPENWVPIGLLENATLLQNKQVNQLFEIGSKRSFIIPGRTYKRLNLSRILFNGDSLMKMVTKTNAGSFPTGVQDTPADNSGDPFYIDLAAGFFNQPVNLGFVLNDQENQRYGAFALKGCVIQSHQLALTGQQTVVMENASLVFDDIVPLAASDDKQTPPDGGNE